MQDEVITSPHNAVLKRARKLRRRQQREAEGAAFVEGIGPVWQAHESDTTIDVLLVAPELLTSAAVQSLIEDVARSGARVAQFTSEAFSSVADRDNPSGIAAIVTTRNRTLEDLAVEGDSTFVALNEIGNPGNLGTIVRTADGAGGAGVITVGDSTDPWHPNALKASMGAMFTVPVCTVDGVDDLLSWCSDNHVAVVTTSARAPNDYRSVEYPPRKLLLFGSEGEGLGDDLVARGDMAVRIPMEGKTTSLNLAVAVGILLYAAR